MTLFQQATKLNNAGIAALVHGDHASAIQEMTLSMKLLKMALAKEQAHGATSHCETTDSTNHSATRRLGEMSTVPIPRSAAHLQSETVIFNQAFQLPTSRVANDTEHITAFDLHVFTSAVLFNLALVHQTIGVGRFLHKAEKLYSIVLALLGDNACLAVRSSIVVKLGCINNLSQIQYLKGDINTMTSTQRRLRAEISAHVVSQSPLRQAMLQEAQIQTLLMNMLLFEPPKMAAAA